MIKVIHLLCCTLLIHYASLGQNTLYGQLDASPQISALAQQKLAAIGIQPVAYPKQEPCSRTKTIDLCFVVDVTSSMADQIHFLQSSIQDLIQDLEQDHDLRFRCSAVTYRDYSDEFITQKTDFSEEASNTMDFLSKYTASGGGDYPEALSEALFVAAQLDWNTEADRRVLFLFSDAPPRQDAASLEVLEKAMALSATQSLTIVPVLGTSTDEFAEALSILLAEQSGGSLIHLLPSEDAVVSSSSDLYELCKNILQELAELAPCDLVDQQEQVEIDASPNPVVNQVTVRVSKGIQSLEIISAEGTMVFQSEAELSEEININTTHWVAGVYFIRCQFADGQATKKIVVQH